MSTATQPRILFISRAYPPVHGGIEDQNFNLGHSLGEITETKIIANKKGKKNLLFFVAQLFLQLPFILRKYDVVLFGDGVLAPVGAFFKIFSHKKKYVSVIHGLDITYAYQSSLMGRIYRRINIPSLKRLDKLIMVGNHTIEEAVKIGIDRDLCTFIPNGVNIEKVYEEHTRDELETLLTDAMSLPPEYFHDKKIILRVGRFVPHKGLHWFIDRVLPELPDDYILVGAGGYNPKAVGDSENYTLCTELIEKHSLQKRVALFPNVEQYKMNILFNTADVYISPNIDIKGSMEGFGLNAVEAVVCGRIVLSADLQGLKDAITEGKSGFLLEPEDEKAWKEKIETVLSPDFDRKAFTATARDYVLARFTWNKIAAQYVTTLQEL